MRDAPEQVRKRGEIPCPVRLEMVQRLEGLAERRKLIGVGAVDTQPCANRFQGHADDYAAMIVSRPCEFDRAAPRGVRLHAARL